MKYSLDYIWECLNTIEPDATEEEKRILRIVAKNSEILATSISDEQAKLFEIFQDSLYELFSAEKRGAFIKGIKFATQFFLEATEK